MRAAFLRTPVTAAVLGVVAGLGLIVAVFLPWYAANIGTTFTPESSSGWDATGFAKPVLVLGVAVALASLLLAADVRGVLPLDAGVARALMVVVIVCAALALALVAYRMLVLPEPADFLSRRIGLWAGVLAAAAGVAAGLGLLTARG